MNKIRCQSCFNFLEFCPCGLPEREPYEVAGEIHGILIPEPPAPSFDEAEVVVIAISTSFGEEDPEPAYDPSLADEVFSSMVRHPSGGYTLIDEIERFLQEGD